MTSGLTPQTSQFRSRIPQSITRTSGHWGFASTFSSWAPRFTYVSSEVHREELRSAAWMALPMGKKTPSRFVRGRLPSKEDS